MISGSKFHRLEQALFKSRDYAKALYEIIENILLRNNSIIHPLFYRKDKGGPELLIVFLADRGLCGNFNSNLLKAVEKINSENGKMKIWVIRDEVFVDNIIKKILEYYKEYSKIKILYTEFKSVSARKIIYEQLLPLKSDKKKYIVDYIYGIEEEEILEQLAREFLSVKIKHVLLESITSEESARMAAMDSASRNAEDMIVELTRAYNIARHEALIA